MARQVFSNDVGNQGDGRLGADRDGRSPSGRAATPSGPSPKTVSGIAGIPNAVRRTISDFVTAPRDGTPFHILNTMRFNPLMERWETLMHSGDDLESRVWRPAPFHCEPSVWLRRVPLPYEIPDGQWFSITYVCKPKRSFWRRALGRLADALARMAEWTAGSSHVADVARLPLTMEWSHSRWRPVPASGIVAAEGGRDPKGLDERSEQSPVGEAETPTPPPVHP
jgi:hypothetical protein